MYQRYAIYYTPDGAFAQRGATWLGWDAALGTAHAQDAQLSRATQRPRKYGFHGTIKAPFRLKQNVTESELQSAVERLCLSLAPAPLGALELAQIGRFLAFVLRGDGAALSALARQCVQQLDPYRAALSEAEIAKRRPDRLSARQRDNLMRWGYPFVMADFKFHMTLTGNLKPEEIAAMRGRAERHFTDAIPEPLIIDALSLMGEDSAGQFHLISRHPLGRQSVT